MNRIRYIGAVVLTALILIFALQNLEAVSVRLFIWEIGASVALIALGPFLVGLVIGSATTFIRARRARARELRAGEDRGVAEPGERSSRSMP